tara:strand:+ start:705 stop:3239 length:2535 start_codon:yes stop_codon:yes gene_type:complete
MAVTWITPAGDLGTLEERIITSVSIEATTDTNNAIEYSVIAGELPKGMLLSGSTIKGSPAEVTKFTEYRFVIRADDNDKEKDRTFKISVNGADIPEWITKAGFLNVGPGQAYFVLDDAPVDFQLEATDDDVVAGESLEYYLVPNSGILPYGLKLSKTGRISGFTQPIPAIDYTTSITGAYDTASFDTVPLDIAQNNSLGFDSFFYDNQYYDYGEQGIVPKKLSRVYTFGIAITDGINAVNRIFKIYVVSEEFLRADNTLVQVDTNLFQADATSNRVPFWITDSYLGRYRANNYITLFLDVYDPPTLSGVISYFIVDNNPDGTPSTLPPGLTIDNTTGELAGKVPYQAAVTKTYQFTLKAVNFPASIAQQNYTLVGDWSSTRFYETDEAVRYDGFVYVCKQENINQLPITPNSIYWELGVGTTDKTFTVDIIGEIDSSIEWNTDSDLGIIKPNQPSRKAVEATSLLYGGRVSYTITSGELPPGLEFLSNGNITGKVTQFADADQQGLTRFFDRDSSTVDSTGTISYNTKFDTSTTTYDKVYTFTVEASDSSGLAKDTKTFTIKVVADSQKSFANIFVKAFQNKDKRLNWFNFITDATIFVPDDIYRYGDTNFGIQTEIKSLIFAGIESTSATPVVQALSRNHYNKRFTFGPIKKAQAKDSTTQQVLYEVVYVDLVDEYEKDNKSISSEINLPDNSNSKVLVSYDNITIDSDIPYASDADLQRVFPNSVKNMRKRISEIGERDREFLPLWMRSIQQTSTYELGFTKALVLCYANPNRADSIISRIKSSGFDFKTIDFTADRYIIDILNGQIQDTYVQFPQDKITNHANNASKSTEEKPFAQKNIPS